MEGMMKLGSDASCFGVLSGPILCDWLALVRLAGFLTGRACVCAVGVDLLR